MEAAVFVVASNPLSLLSYVAKCDIYTTIRVSSRTTNRDEPLGKNLRVAKSYSVPDCSCKNPPREGYCSTCQLIQRVSFPAFSSPITTPLSNLLLLDHSKQLFKMMKQVFAFLALVASASAFVPSQSGVFIDFIGFRMIYF